MLNFYFFHVLIIIIFLWLWSLLAHPYGACSWLSKKVPGSRRFVFRLATLAFFLRLGGMAVIMLAFPEIFDPASPFFLQIDKLTYHEDASALASIWKGTYLPTSWLVESRYSGYPYFLAGIYYLTGPSYIAGALVNNILGVFTCIVTYRLGREIFNENVGRAGSLLLAIFPMHIYICAFTLKDSLALLLLVSCVYFGYKISYAKMWLLWFTLLNITIFLLLYIRIQIVVLLLAICFLGVMVARGDTIKKIALLILILSAVLLTHSYKIAFDTSFDLANIDRHFQLIKNYRSITNELSGRIQYIFYAFGYFMPIPTLYPVEYISTSYQTESSTLVWNILAPFSLIGIICCWRKNWRAKWFAWAPALLIFIGQSMLYVYTALDMRHKLMVVPFAVLLVAYGLGEWKSPWRNTVIFLYLACWLIGSFFYTYLRMKAWGLV